MAMKPEVSVATQVLEPSRTEALAPSHTAAELAKARAAAFHIPSLDGIRALSFLTVFFGHAGLGKFVPGYFGLNLFFFLSGYLITTLMRLEFDQTGTVSFRQFYLRRALRILPPFYLVLFVAYALTALGLTGGSITLRAVLAQVCHVTNYYIVGHGWWEGLAPGTWVYWSLAVEEHFYFVFPLVYLWSRRRFPDARKQALVLFVACVLVLAWRCVLVFALHAPKDRMYVASDTRVDSILAGCILAIFKNPVHVSDRIDEGRLIRLWLPLGGVAVLVGLVVRIPWFEQTFRYSLQSFGLMPFFMAAMLFHDRWPFRWLNWAPVRRIGVFSYSMYLMHTVVLWCLERWFGLSPLLSGPPALIVLVSAAGLMHRYIEKPAARMRRRLSVQPTAQ